MKFRVINGGRKNLEDKVMRSMSKGNICASDLDKLKPWGKLSLVKEELTPSEEEEHAAQNNRDFSFYS